MIGFGQNEKLDEIIFSNGDTIYGTVIEVGVNKITYRHKGEVTNNITKSRELAKITYASGRTENFDGLRILERKQEKRIKEKFKVKKEKNANTFQPTFEIGAVIGLTSSNIYGKMKDLNESANYSVNFIQRANGGLMLQYNVSKLFSINSKLLYQVKGRQISGHVEVTSVELPDGSIGSFYFDIYTHDHYISIPILCKFNFGDKLKGIINTGFYTSYLLKTMEEQRGDGLAYTFRDYVNPNYQTVVNENKGGVSKSLDGLNRIDFGLVFGGGISYTINERIRLLLDFYTELGLVNGVGIRKSAFSQYNISYNLLSGCSYIF